MKKQRHHYELNYKRRLVQVYLSGVISAEELEKRDSLSSAATSGLRMLCVR